jgi:hypothetical protein
MKTTRKVSCGPSVANLYLAHFENRYKSVLNSNIYYRYIDDLFFIFNLNFDLNIFKKIFSNLKFTIATNKSVTFLDLNISLNIDSSLNFDSYIKPTNTFSYLCTSSNHHYKIFNSIPICLIHRIRRNCTEDNRYLFHATNLYYYLSKRNYNSKLVMNIIRNFFKVLFEEKFFISMIEKCFSIFWKINNINNIIFNLNTSQCFIEIFNSFQKLSL